MCPTRRRAPRADHAGGVGGAARAWQSRSSVHILEGPAASQRVVVVSHYRRPCGFESWLERDHLQNLDFDSQLEFSEDERVLDVGCGDGLLTRAAARMLPLGYAVRVDASPRMIATAHAATAPTESGPCSWWLTPAAAFRAGSSMSWCLSTRCTGFPNSSRHVARRRSRQVVAAFVARVYRLVGSIAGGGKR